MRVSEIKLQGFRRFRDLKISGLPDTARLVLVAGPNGSGKSSLFDAFAVRYHVDTGFGWSGDNTYYSRDAGVAFAINNSVDILLHSGKSLHARGSLYLRSAYRNDPEFRLSTLNRQPSLVDDMRFRRMIEGDAVVSSNYERLASQAFEDLFEKETPSTTIGEFRERVVGEIRDAVKRLFPDLILNSLGNPLSEGTFRFNKGSAQKFEYKNLSGGEKAAFDLILDIVVKRKGFQDAIYIIDEPEAHMNTKLQGALLEELYNLIPQQSQLWVGTHSIGMMRKARELYERDPTSVVFIDFGGHDFDNNVVITPSRPSRAFWEEVLNVALDDLSKLVAPREVVVCEGNPAGAIPGKNAEHDATIYNIIFSDEFPDVKFIAGGNNKDVAADRLGFAAALPLLAPGMKVRRLIDRDDHALADVQKFKAQGITTLKQRHLEAYVYDDEVLEALCASVGRPQDYSAVVADKQQALADSVSRGNPHDDIKSAAGTIYTRIKQRLGLTAVGNDQMAFARNTLASLIKPDMRIYSELKSDVFD